MAYARLKRLDHQRSATLPTSFIAMKEIGNAPSSGLNFEVSIDWMATVDLLILFPKGCKHILPALLVFKRVSSKNHLRCFSEKSINPITHTQHRPVDPIAAKVWLSESHSYQVAINPNWEQLLVLVDQMVKVPASIGLRLPCTGNLAKEVNLGT